MSNSIDESYPHKFERNIVDGIALLKKHRWPTLGVILVTTIAVGWAWWRIESLGGQVSELKEQNHSLSTELGAAKGDVSILESRYAPFKVIAMQNFPGEAEAHAIANLATQFRKLEEKLSNQVNSFGVELRTRLRGKWKTDYTPDRNDLITLSGEGSETFAKAQLRLTDGSSHEVEFTLKPKGTVTLVGEGEYEIVQLVMSGGESLVYISKRSNIVGFDSFVLFFPSIIEHATEDNKIEVVSFSAALLVNGERQQLVPVRKGKMIDISEMKSLSMLVKGPFLPEDRSNDVPSGRTRR